MRTAASLGGAGWTPTSAVAICPPALAQKLEAGEPTVLLLAGRDLPHGLNLDPIVSDLRRSGIEVAPEPLRLGHLLFSRLDLVATLKGLELDPPSLGLERCGAAISAQIKARCEHGGSLSGTLRIPRRLGLAPLIAAFEAKGYGVRRQEATPDSQDVVLTVFARKDR